MVLKGGFLFFYLPERDLAKKCTHGNLEWDSGGQNGRLQRVGGNLQALSAWIQLSSLGAGRAPERAGGGYRGRVEAEGRALDICCGLGTNTIFLARKGFSTFALDISSTAVARAKGAAKKAGAEVFFLVGNGVKLPFASGSCELPLAFARGFLPHDRKFLLPGKDLPHNHRMSGDME